MANRLTCLCPTCGCRDSTEFPCWPKQRRACTSKLPVVPFSGANNVKKIVSAAWLLVPAPIAKERFRAQPLSDASSPSCFGSRIVVRIDENRICRVLLVDDSDSLSARARLSC